MLMWEAFLLFLPLLFLVCINDMKQCSDKFSFMHYADDTNVSLSGKKTWLKLII